MGTPLLQQAAMLANRVAPFSATVLAHTTLLLAAGLLIYRLMRRQGAVVQSVVLKAFLVSTLAIPVIVLIGNYSGIPHVTVRMPVEQLVLPLQQVKTIPGGIVGELTARTAKETSQAEMGLRSADVTAGKIGNNSSILTSVMFRVPVFPASVQNSPSIRSLFYLLLTTIWFGASLYLLCRFGFGLATGWVLRSRAEYVNPILQRAGDWLASRYGLSMPYMLRSDHITAPFLTGIIRPVVMIPRNIRLTSDVILHELCHFVNGDCFWNMLSHAVMIFYPLQPLAHLLSRELEDVNDFVCDDFVISDSSDPRAYALELVTYAERAAKGGIIPDSGAALVPARSTLRRRVERIITTDGMHTSHNAHRIALPVALVCAVLVSLAAFVEFEGVELSLEEHFVQYDFFEHILARHLTKKNLADAAHYQKATKKIAEENGFFMGAPVSSGMLSTSLINPVAPPDKENIQDGRPAVTADVFNGGDLLDRQNRRTAMISLLATQYQVAAVDASEESYDKTDYYSQYDFPEPVTATRDSEDDYLTDTCIETIPSAYYADGLAVEPVWEDVNPLASNEIDSTTTLLASIALPETIPLDLSIFKNYKECIEAGIAFTEAEKYFNALKIFKRAAKFKPNDAMANYLIGCTYFRTHDFDKAKWFIQVAIAIDPGNPEFYYSLGDVIRLQGDLGGAWEQYKIAYNINPALVVENEAILF